MIQIFAHMADTYIFSLPSIWVLMKNKFVGFSIY